MNAAFYAQSAALYRSQIFGLSIEPYWTPPNKSEDFKGLFLGLVDSKIYFELSAHELGSNTQAPRWWVWAVWRLECDFDFSTRLCVDKSAPIVKLAFWWTWKFTLTYVTHVIVLDIYPRRSLSLYLKEKNRNEIILPYWKDRLLWWLFTKFKRIERGNLYTGTSYTASNAVVLYVWMFVRSFSFNANIPHRRIIIIICLLISGVLLLGVLQLDRRREYKITTW